MLIRLNIEAETIAEFDALFVRFQPIEDGGTNTFNHVANSSDNESNTANIIVTGGKPRGRPRKGENVTPEPTTFTPPSDNWPPAPVVAESGPIVAPETPVVTVEQLKVALAELMKVVSATDAQRFLDENFGCRSISGGSPSIVEKAASDPSIMRQALDAMTDAVRAAA